MAQTHQQRKAEEPPMASANPSPDEEATHPLTEFELYPNLPTEIRMMIWKLVCFHPRYVDFEIRQRGSVNSEFPPATLPQSMHGQIPLYSYYSETRIPPALQVNKELRVEALKWYQLAFGREIIDRGFTITFPAKIYVNFEVDTLCWMDWRPRAHVGADMAGTRLDYETAEFSGLCQSQGVRSLVFNVGQSSYYTDARLQYYQSHFAFLDEIIFLSEPTFVAIPWKYNTIELGKLRWMPSTATQWPSLAAVKKTWKLAFENFNSNHIPELKYMKLLRKPGFNYATIYP